MKKLFFLLLLFLPCFLFAQQPGANPQIIIDWNEVGMVGTMSGNGLVLPKGDPVPYDFSPPLFSNFGIEAGVRYPIFFDKDNNVSFAVESPLQLGLVSTTGPSTSVPKNSTSIWISVPVMVAMHHGLGASYENTDKKIGAYIGIGAAYNKALIREKTYAFYASTPVQVVYPFRFVGYFTANAMTGIRWRNRNGMVRNLGLEGNYGIYGEWMVGISFGSVLGM
jgi:hypothetical protein